MTKALLFGFGLSTAFAMMFFSIWGLVVLTQKTIVAFRRLRDPFYDFEETT